MPTTGTAAPGFTLLNQHDEPVDLAAFRGRPVLVYFYPKASTPGCTQQACALRDVADQIGDTVVLGISPDAPAAQRKFADRHGLGFDLLSDPDHAVAESYGVWKEKQLYGKRYMGIERSAFLVDAQGVLSHAWRKISPADTPKKLLEALGR